MDQKFVELLESINFKEHPDETDNQSFSLLNDVTGEVEVKGEGAPVRYNLKPLAELFASESSASSSIDWRKEPYIDLLWGIEERIVDYDHSTPGLSDGIVGLTLDRMIANPSSTSATDPLCLHIQMGMRWSLSLKDFSKSEVKLALRKIAKSVELHTSRAGHRGYLDFIAQHL